MATRAIATCNQLAVVHGDMASRFAGRGQSIYRGLMTTFGLAALGMASTGWRQASAKSNFSCQSHLLSFIDLI